MVKVDKRVVSRTGVASLGWFCGYGYVRRKYTVKTDVWCVMEGSEVLAECRSKKKAERIKEAFDWVGHV